MKVPLSWIREFVDVTASAEEIGTLTQHVRAFNAAAKKKK